MASDETFRVPAPKRVLVTRAAEDAPVLAHALARNALQAVAVPLVRRVWELEPLAGLARSVPEAGWVLLTSATVADVVATAVPSAWRSARWAAVGPVTAKRATALGYRVAVTTAGTGVDLAGALGPLDGVAVILPRGDLAADDLPAALRAKGAIVHEALAYRNVEPSDAKEQLAAVLPVDATALMSGSAAERLAALVPERERLGYVAAIGPSTAQAAKKAGLRVDVVASVHSVEGIAAVLAAWDRG